MSIKILNNSTKFIPNVSGLQLRRAFYTPRNGGNSRCIELKCRGAELSLLGEQQPRLHQRTLDSGSVGLPQGRDWPWVWGGQQAGCLGSQQCCSCWLRWAGCSPPRLLFLSSWHASDSMADKDRSVSRSLSGGDQTQPCSWEVLCHHSQGAACSFVSCTLSADKRMGDVLQRPGSCLRKV